MSTRKKNKKTTIPHQEGIDRLVISQADDDSAWEAPIRVKLSKPASLSIPGELAARASFLARLHREAGVDKWVERVVRERVELEEFAFIEAKKKLASLTNFGVNRSKGGPPMSFAASRQPAELSRLTFSLLSVTYIKSPQRLQPNRLPVPPKK